MKIRRLFMIGLMCFIGQCMIVSNAFSLSVVPVYANVPAIRVSAQQPVFQIIQMVNFTTGYRWANPVYDHEVLQLMSMIYKKESNSRMGSGGQMVWTFRVFPHAFTAFNKKTTLIILTYLRPWNPKDHPRRVVYHVQLQH